jgi:alpha-tubulin suppressor-like RCC1 family protein
MSGVAAVSAGAYHTMILKIDGSLWATGINNTGQLGDGTTTARSMPVQVMSGIAAVSAGNQHTMILKTDGSLWACGLNYEGELGDGTTTDRYWPVQTLLP